MTSRPRTRSTSATCWCRWSAARSGVTLLEDRAGLLVADEVHKYGSARPAETLREGFGARLGLTTSVERQDAGVDEVLRPYFGTVLDGCDLRRGRAEGVLGGSGSPSSPWTSTPPTRRSTTHCPRSCTRAARTPRRVRLCAGHVPRRRDPAAGRLAGERASRGRRQRVAARGEQPARPAGHVVGQARCRRALAPGPRPVHPRLVFTHAKDDADTAAARSAVGDVPASWFHNRSGARGPCATPCVTSTQRRRDGAHRAEGARRGSRPAGVDAVVCSPRAGRPTAGARVSPVLHADARRPAPVVVVVTPGGRWTRTAASRADLTAVATEVRTFDVGTLGAAVAGLARRRLDRAAAPRHGRAACGLPSPPTLLDLRRAGRPPPGAPGRVTCRCRAWTGRARRHGSR